MGTTYAPIDPEDTDALRAWWEVSRAADAYDRPYDLFPTWEQTVAAIPKPNPDFSVVLLGAYDDAGGLVGAGMVGMPEREDTTLAYLDVRTHPQARRHGVGTGLFLRLRHLALMFGRRTVHVEVPSPLDADSPGVLMARSLGLVAGNIEELKVFELSSAWDTPEALVSPEYRIEVLPMPVPDERVAGICSFYSGFMRMVPTGDLEFDDAIWDAQRLRVHEARTAEIGRTRLLAAALHGEEVVALSEVGWTLATPARANVGITGVLPEHRGHGLGLAVKLAVQRALVEAEPGCRMITTQNAEVNEHMNAVNDRLGFRVVERVLVFQGRVA